MFSGTIKIADIDDYIKPSQECVLPMMTKSNEKISISEDLRVERVEEVKMSFPNLIKTTEKKTAKVTLNDCLACKGCVTTAETILIAQQGIEEFLNSIPKWKHTIISLSPQSRVSLAYFFGMDEKSIQICLSNFFKSIGVGHTFDITTAIDLTMSLSKEEFLRRIKEEEKGPLPIICSECPGWVCFAEKVVEEFVIPHMSRVKSPQQIMGILIKYRISETLACNPKDIYHVTVMPCYDKKLESVRAENSEISDNCVVKEVDTVLSTKEITELLFKVSGLSCKEELKKYLQTFGKGSGGARQFEEFFLPELSCKEPALYLNDPESSSSNAYLETMIRAAMGVLKPNNESLTIEIKKGKNSDYTEYHLLGNSNKVLMKFLRIYGFRNIQNFVRNLKLKKSEFHYVEIMACPSGCLNGGGQIIENTLKSKELIEVLTKIYHNIEEKTIRTEDSNPAVKIIIGECEKAKLGFTTNFKSVKTASANLKW